MYGTKANTYHWDTEVGNDGWLLGHSLDNPDGAMPHLQIHPASGKEIRIFSNMDLEVIQREIIY